jgi:hypothetical protein
VSYDAPVQTRNEVSTTSLMLSNYFMIFLIAFLHFIGAFAVTQIASETKASPSTSWSR